MQLVQTWHHAPHHDFLVAPVLFFEPSSTLNSWGNLRGIHMGLRARARNSGEPLLLFVEKDPAAGLPRAQCGIASL